MIHVEKDFNNIPPSLLSEIITEQREFMRVNKVPPEDDRSTIRLHKDVREKLNKIYNGKCAYCETRIDHPGFHPQVNFYRPKSKYFWLKSEWSNLHLSCQKCNVNAARFFPIDGEEVVEPQNDFQAWRADSESFLAEKPLLLNPEIDDTENYLGFHPDGRIFALDNNQRAIVTINGFGLNRPEVVKVRKSCIDMIVYKVRVILSEKRDIDKKIRELLAETTHSAQANHEYSLLYRYILNNFYVMIIENNFGDEDFALIRSANISKSVLKGAEKQPEEDSIYMGNEEKSEDNLQTITLNSIRFSNVKCFQNINLDFENTSAVIIGTNGRGKTTILQVIALILSGLERPPVVTGWTGVIKRGAEESGGALCLESDGKKNYIGFIIDDDDRIRVTNGVIPVSNRKHLFFAAYGNTRNSYRYDVVPNKQFENIATLFNSPGYMKNIKDTKVYKIVENNFKPIQDLINSVFKAADPDHLVQLSRFSDDGFYFKTPSDPAGETPLEAMSDGFNSIFSMLFDIASRVYEAGYDLYNLDTIPGIILIDEIDLHLHPSWQRTILPMLTETFKSIQFIVTTHSPFIVQSLNENTVFHLVVKGDGVSVKKMDTPGVPQGYDIKQVIEKVFGSENAISPISNTLRNLLGAFDKAVTDGDKTKVTQLYRRIKKMIPPDSSFTEYLEIMSAGLVEGE